MTLRQGADRLARYGVPGCFDALPSRASGVGVLFLDDRTVVSDMFVDDNILASA
jgi:hypothetical protein